MYLAPEEWQEDPDYEAAGCPDDYTAEGYEGE